MGVTSESLHSVDEMGPRGGWNRILAFLIRYRVRISLILFVLMIAEDFWIGFRPHDLLNFHDINTVVGIALVAAGLTLRSWAAGILHKTCELTTRGPYALVRHPLYAGSFLMMIGFCLLIDDPENIWLVCGPFAVLYLVKVLHEEHKLSAKFGSKWQEYARAVPRFLPTRLPRDVVAAWRAQQWIGNREYQAVVATLLGLVALEIWATLA